MKQLFKKFILLFLVTLLTFPPGLITAATVTESDVNENVFLHHDFETEDTHGWEPLSWASAAQVETTTEVASTGEQSLKFFDRADRESSLALDLTSKLDKGETYTISFDVKMSEGTDKLRLASKYVNPDDENQYPWLIGNKDVGSDNWTTFELKDFDYHAAATELIIFIESDGEGSAPDFYIDNFKVVKHEKEDIEVPTNVVIHHDFETEDTHGWAPLSWASAAQVETTTEAASTGEQSLKFFNRADRRSSLALDLTSKLDKGETYTISFDVKMSEGTDKLRLASKYVNPDDENQYPWLIGNKDVGSDNWTTFELKDFDYHSAATELIIFIESDGEGSAPDFYIDNFKVIQHGGVEAPTLPPAAVMEMITFEDGELNGFRARGNNEVLTVVDGVNKTEGGNYSLLIENRQQNWNGPTLDVIDYVDQGSEYDISVWVKMREPNSAQLTLSTQVGDGDGASYNNITSATVTDQEWVELRGTYRYSSLGGGNLSIYVESNNANASFYIDDISFVKTDAGSIEVQDLTPIKDVYEEHFLIGNAVNMAEFEGVRLQLLDKHFNLVTAENAMKPGYMYDSNGDFNFNAPNALVQRAIDEGFKVHGHVLVWHSQSHDGLYYDTNGNPLDRDTTIANMHRHIEATMTNFAQNDEFRDAVISWDVVNEAIVPRAGVPLENWREHIRRANNGWYDTLGADYVEIAFKKAKEVKKDLGLDVTLYYNDYNDDDQNKSTIIYHMIKDINERYQNDYNTEELLIEAMGMQAHYNMNTNPENVRLSMERFIDLGVEIGVTELDVTAGDDGVQTEAQARRQAYIYASLFKLYKEHSEHISRVTFWGLNDSTSWRATQTPLLFDRNLQAKLAYDAVIDPEGFLASYEEDAIPVRQGEAVFTETAPVLNGEIDAVWANAPRLSINRFQQAWNTATGVARVLWDEDNLYVLFEVSDSELDKSNENAWEQDSVELFLDQRNAKAPNFTAVPGVGQYRVNFDNQFSQGSGNAYQGFESATKVNGTSYVVEMKIPLSEITPQNGTVIGFDAQVNDAADGSRVGVATWNDTTGRGWSDPSVFGEIKLVRESSGDVEETEIEVGKEVIVYPTQKVVVKDKKVSIVMPNDLPIGTTIVVEPYQGDDFTSSDGKVLKVAGEVITINLVYPDGYENFKGNFILELGYNPDFEHVGIYYLGENGWELRGGEMDKENHVIRITVTGFSTYGVFEVEEDDNGSGDDGSGDNGSGDNGSGDDGSGDNGSGDNGSGDNGSGDNGSGDNGSGNDGSGDNGSGDNGSGDNGSGDDGSGDNGSGDDGSGDDGSGDNGSGDDGSGDDGSGDNGSGDDGSGDDGSGDDGSGDDGSGDNGSGDDKKGGEKLPDTATYTFTMLLIGFLTLIAGAIFLAVVYRREGQMN